MASTKVSQTLQQLDGPSTSQQEKPSGYQALLDYISSSSTQSELVPNLESFIGSILGEGLGIVAVRPLLSAAIESIRSISNIEAKVKIGTNTLIALEPRVISFEEQDAMLREIVADAFTAREDFTEAAKILQGIQLESSQRRLSDDYKVGIWIRICRLYLEEDDTTSAESYLNRAKNLRHKVENQELNLQFQLSEARILDARRRFLDASQVYHSFSFSSVLDEEERTRALSSAIICAVLAPAGPQRARALAKLYKDDRASQVPEFGILEKMFFDRLLSPNEVARFANNLSPHQLAQTSDGSTVLAKAVVEHNLLSVSKLYNNIGFEELGSLLGLSSDKAEEYAARMLEQGRITGRIDQIDGLIFFDGGEGTGERTTSGQGNGIVGRDLRKWDAKVQGVAEELERVASMLQTSYPVRGLNFFFASTLTFSGFCVGKMVDQYFRNRHC